MKKSGPPSIFIAPIDLSGIYSAMTSGLREIGVRADFLNLGTDSNGQWDRSQSEWPVRFYVSTYETTVARITDRSLSQVRRALIRFRWIACQLVLVAWVALRYDVIILRAGLPTGVSHELDLWLYRKLGKKIIVIFQGSDSRPPFLLPDKPYETPAELMLRTEIVRERVLRAHRIADIVVENPLSSQNHDRKCCVAQMVGIAVDERKLAPGLGVMQANVGESGSGRSIRILHGPSSPALKGSDRIRACIASLRAKGHEIDYVEITGRPNAEVMIELARCDIVIDQMYSDTYGSVFATEAIGFGRPVVVCGYGREFLERFVPEEATVPLIYCAPMELEAIVEQLIIDPDHRRRVGAAGRDFFTRFADSRSAARRLLRLAAGEAPESWFFDPKEVLYAKGTAGTEERVARNIRKLLDVYGENGLLLDGKPALKREVVAFARTHSS